MEDIVLHILPYLDLKTVLNCRQVLAQEWVDFIDKNRRFWLRELRARKLESIYFEPQTPYRVKKITEVFPDWERVFEYFEKVETEKLKEFVCALEAPYDYLRREKDDTRLKEIMNPLHIEALHGRHELINILLESPLDFNCKTILNDESEAGEHTILHIAASNGDIELVKLIFSHAKDKNIDLNSRNSENSTPFHMACEGCVQGIGTSYYTNQPKDEIDQSFGLTFSQAEVIKFYLQNSSEFGIDLNAEGALDETPFTALINWSLSNLSEDDC